jgi:hypothetical protein
LYRLPNPNCTGYRQNSGVDAASSNLSFGKPTGPASLARHCSATISLLFVQGKFFGSIAAH